MNFLHEFFMFAVNFPFFLPHFSAGPDSLAWQHCSLVHLNVRSDALRSAARVLLASSSTTNHRFKRPGMDEIPKHRLHPLPWLSAQLAAIFLPRAYALLAQLLASARV